MSPFGSIHHGLGLRKNSALSQAHPQPRMPSPNLSILPDHGRFPYSGIRDRQNYRWPTGAGLAVYIGMNVEHFAFSEGLGACIAPPVPQPDVLNYSWREYGNRVGVWRCLSLFDQLAFPTGALLNTALYDHCPEVVRAFSARGDELIAHGHTNTERQGDFDETGERLLIERCKQRMETESGQPITGWLSPWISESTHTPDLLAQAGYQYTLNWCHDDQPTRMSVRGGRSLWSIPYPQELNDIPTIVARHLEAPAFAEMIIDQFDEMREQARTTPLVMGIALHPYIVGQPHRLRHLRRALEHIARARDAGDIWITTPGRICSHVDALFPFSQR